MKQDLSDQELLASNTDSLSQSQLERRRTLSEIIANDNAAEEAAHNNREFRDKQAESRRRAAAGRMSLQQENERIANEQRGCAHLSGGKNYQGWLKGDGRHGYVIATQQLPDGSIYYLCFRCQRSWFKADMRHVVNYYKPTPEREFEPKLSIEEYRQKMQEYSWAQMAATKAPLFECDGGGIPGSVLFRIPALEKKRALDQEEFYALAAEKGWPLAGAVPMTSPTTLTTSLEAVNSFGV